jgi:beta-N-acetylhexosaminidase
MKKFQTLTREDVRRCAGQAIICGFEGTKVTAELREIVREVQPLGLILFARNIESPEQLAELCAELKSLRKDQPMLLSVDQEGGRVARIRAPATEWPAMRMLGRIDDPKLTERVGRALARELRAMGFDVDFAPVLDVDTNPKNPVIGDRSFGSDAKVVARHGVALIRGLQGGGVAACGKHFPGHGDTEVDSHTALPYVGHELGRLREVEWPPFREAARAGLSSVMTAHVVVETLDELPATLSKRALAPLREELGFRGVIISDDLEMKAVASHYPMSDLATLGMNAGCDIFLACQKPEVILSLYRSLVHAAEEQKITHETLDAASKRAVAWRRAYYKAPVKWEKAKHDVGCAEHLDLRAEIDRRLAVG